MENERDRESGRIVPANDNDDASGLPDSGTWHRVDHAALTLARIIGRRLGLVVKLSRHAGCGLMV